MPSIPSYDGPKVAARAVGAPSFSMQAPDASGFTRGLAQAEAGVMQMREKAKEEADTAFAMDSVAEVERFAQQLKTDPETGLYNRKGKNALNITNEALDAMTKKWDEIERRATNDQQRARIQQLRQADLSRESRFWNQYEFDQRESYKAQAEDSVLETSLQGAAADYNDPEKLNHYLNRGSAVIQSRANRMGMDEESVALAQGKFRNDLAATAIQMMTPSEQMDVLSKQGLADMLEPAKRQALHRQAIEGQEAQIRMQLAKEDRARREQERYEKVMLEEATKEGDNLLANGELTEEWIEANRDNLGASEYRHFYKQLREGANLNTDPQHYANLRIRVSQGDDVREEARESVRRGSLSLTDYDKLITASERNAPLSSVPNVYKRGSEYIRNSLRVSDMNPDPAAAQRLASALDDWNEWVSDNSSATAAESREQYKRITEEYALIDYEQMTLTKRLPRFASATRSNMDLDQIRIAEEQTVVAFQAGQITEEEFNEQAVLLREWGDALRKRTGAQQ